ncbi:ATP-binding protein [Desulfococcaceae bacterium HSG9]|nr:ATP-binding protein [Desulfococcaceae bacterium HSG9]
MLKKHLGNLSLNTLLVITVIITVVLTITIYTVITYKSTKEKRFAEIKEHSQLIIDVTHQVVGGLIASYNVNEYEQVLIGEMGRNDILAIIINDNNMGKIIGQETFVNGKIRNDQWEIIDFDSQNELHKNLLKKNCYVVKNDIVYNGNLIGTVEVYGADRFMIIELNTIIRVSIMSGIILSLFLVTTLLASIRLIVVNPLHKITHLISNADSDGIPLNNIPVSGSSEISSLSFTMNNMIDMIRQSRVKLRSHQENLEGIVAARTQELVKEKKNADRANLAKSRFLANMSHELRTPLNGILGYAQILKRDPNDLTTQQHGLDVIEQSGRHLLTLIDDVLDLAKVESGKIELYQSDFSLNSLIRGVSEMIRIRAERKGVTFCLEKSANLPAYVHGDEKRLRQILLNLLGNAIKFTIEGRVTFRIQECGLQSADLKEPLIAHNHNLNHNLNLKDPKSEISKIRFAVEDTGIGITPEDQKSIFDPFEQAGDHNYKAKGTGLGLAISRNLAELMGSKLYVESQIGLGSAFRFDLTLPVVQYKSEIKEIRQIIGIKGKPPTILTVDDNRENRMVLLDMLRPLGFNVLEAVNGRDGLDKAIDSQPDVIITDLVMPEMDGFELIRRIRQSPELQKTIIFTVSASAFAEDQTRSVTTGSDAFLPKPVQAENLFEQLEHHLNLTWLERKPVEAPDLSDRPIIFPPPETIAELYELSMDGEIGELAERVSALAQSDARLEPFINKMNRLIKIYQLGQISEWLAPHINKKEI